MDCSSLDFSGKIVLVTVEIQEIARKIARVVMFLASAAINDMTGHDFVMNGGAFFR